ncbi:hypothetical protein STEG23_000705, partial [Scotinomys teguina]
MLVSKATDRCRVDVGENSAKPSLPPVAASGLQIMKAGGLAQASLGLTLICLLL